MFARTFWTAAACLGMLAHCGKEEAAKPAGPPATFCKDGDRVCKGNYQATCTGGGTAYSLVFCGDKSCQGGQCVATVCPKNQKTCDGKAAVLQCPADGLTEATTLVKCKAANPIEACNDGVCLPNACKADEARCGDKTLFVCTKGIWALTPCASNQYCDAAAKACKDRSCQPAQQQCKDGKTYQVCDAMGATWSDKPCPGGEGCFDGVCHTIVAAAAGAKDASSGGTADAPSGETSDSVSIGTGDTLVKPKKDIDLGVPDVFKVTLGDTKAAGPGDQELSMDFPGASFLPVLKALQISGNKDNIIIEVQIGPIEDFQTGTFSQVGGEAGETLVSMGDGSGRAGGKHPWQSADYDIELTTFEDSGGRVIGKFSAELVNGKQKKYLKNGVFDIKRN
ncbi:MAG: hypothetical protein FJ100_15610 [Deltaproteobacteria bacterium]|nr:hypothetical protein [Deltaproteobacteria bacterium]